MTALPPSLAPWSGVLSLFPRDLAATIGPWLPRLDLAFGRLPRPRTKDDGPPDGFSGLSRRGAPERLLMSEWMLAMEEPLEFERRLVMGESLHLRLERRAPAGAKRTVILTDVGPSQLGPPRLGQLASLLVLAARAEAAQVELVIGALQSDPDTALTSLNEVNIQSWLNQRSPREPNAEDWRRWEAAHRLTSKLADDLWLLGGPRSRAVGPPGVARGEVSEVLWPGQRKLQLLVERRGERGRPMELELPPPEASVRLLRNPFEVPEQRGALLKASLSGALIHLSPSGRRLFLRTAAGLIAFAVDQQGPSRAESRIYSTREQLLVAVGERSKQVVLVTSDGEKLSLLSYGRRGRFSAVHQTAALPEALGFWHPGAHSPPSDLWFLRGAWYLRDQGGTVFRLVVGPPLTIEKVAERVVSWTLAGPQLVMAVDDDGEVGPRIFKAGDGEAPRPTASLKRRAPLEAFVTSDRGRPLWAVRSGEGEWQIDDQRQGIMTMVDPASTVIGLEPRRGALVVLTPARRAILFLRGAREVGRIYLDGTAQDVVTRHDRVAVLLDGGGLRVLHTVDRHELLRIDPEGNP